MIVLTMISLKETGIPKKMAVCAIRKAGISAAIEAISPGGPRMTDSVLATTSPSPDSRTATDQVRHIEGVRFSCSSEMSIS